MIWPKHFFQPKWAILADKSGKFTILIEQYFGQNMHFWPKQPPSAENNVSAQISVRPKFRLFWRCFFQFRPFSQTSVSFDHYIKDIEGNNLQQISPSSHNNFGDSCITAGCPCEIENTAIFLPPPKCSTAAHLMLEQRSQTSRNVNVT